MRTSLEGLRQLRSPGPRPGGDGDTIALSRRPLLLGCVGAFGALAFVHSGIRVLAAPAQYPETIEALSRAAGAEMTAHLRYVGFAGQAHDEGYRGVAYLFTGLATSKLIHAQNYHRILAQLGESIDFGAARQTKIDDTQTNLISAAEAELNTIDNVYPEILQRLASEHLDAAILNVTYAWESHKQHRDLIAKILRWSPSFFESVAKKIDGRTDKLYVCAICGSTLHEVPSEQCPICRFEVSHYRLIPLETFLG